MVAACASAAVLAAVGSLLLPVGRGLEEDSEARRAAEMPSTVKLCEGKSYRSSCDSRGFRECMPSLSNHTHYLGFNITAGLLVCEDYSMSQCRDEANGTFCDMHEYLRNLKNVMGIVKWKSVCQNGFCVNLALAADTEAWHHQICVNQSKGSECIDKYEYHTVQNHCAVWDRQLPDRCLARTTLRSVHKTAGKCAAQGLSLRCQDVNRVEVSIRELEKQGCCQAISGAATDARPLALGRAWVLPALFALLRAGSF